VRQKSDGAHPTKRSAVQNNHGKPISNFRAAQVTLIPIDRATKIPAVYWEHRTTGDHAEVSLGQDTGILTGIRSGYVVVDLDIRPATGKNGAATLAALLNLPVEADPMLAVLRALGPVPLVRTRSGGWHIYFSHPRGVGQPGTPKLDPSDPSYLVSRIGGQRYPGLDIKADGGYVKAPPSEGYQWVLRYPPPPAPDWLLHLAKPIERGAYMPSGLGSNDPMIAAAARLHARDKPGAVAGEGGHEATFRLALDLVRGFQLSTETALDIMVEWSDSKCRPTWSYAELEHKISDAWASERVPLGYLLTPDVARTTDLGNAIRFVAGYAETMKYTVNLGWMAWDEKRFCRDETDIQKAYTQELVKKLFEEAKLCDKPEIKEKLEAWAKKSQGKSHIDAIPDLAKSNRKIMRKAEDFDRNSWLLNLANGTLNLETNGFKPHNREDLLTKLAPVSYEPTAQAPRWDWFLRRVVPDPEVRAFLQRWVGYSLTGHIREHALAFLYGEGANGKSVFLTTISALLGDYATKAPPDFLTLVSGSKHPTETMSLFGARMAWCSEVDQKASWDETRIKDLASADTIKARYMRRDFVEWKPTHKLWIAGNHKPQVGGTDEGIWRRLKLIPFTVTIPENEKDHRLAEHLLGELPGVLNWAIEGCQQWIRYGLGEPRAVREATSEYRKDSDMIEGFLADECEVGVDFETRSGDLYARFVAWALTNGERSKTSQKALGHALKAKGFRDCKVSGARGWTGLRIRPAELPPQGGRVIQGPWPQANIST
jgi:putative DNA primase/helicase